MKTDGTVVQKITAPPEAGFKAPNEWCLTAAVPGPDGSIFIANGYGDSRIFRFDGNGNYRASYAGQGKTDGLFDHIHGLAVDTRYDQPLLLVATAKIDAYVILISADGFFVPTPCSCGGRAELVFTATTPCFPSWRAASQFSTKTHASRFSGR